MLIVCLNDFMCSGVILSKELASHIQTLSGGQATHLDDLLVLHTGHEDVLLVRIRVVLDHVRYLAIRERLDAFPGLRVPDLDVSVIRSGEEFGAFVVKRDIFDGLRMTKEGT